MTDNKPVPFYNNPPEQPGSPPLDRLPDTFRMNFDAAQKIAMSVALLFDRMMTSEKGYIPLSDLIDPRTSNIKTRALEQVDPYSYFVWIYTAIRLGLVLNSNGAFTVSVPTAVWFTKHADEINRRGFKKDIIQSLFEGKATIS